MFKASIILVLLAFGALAYGWVENNDTILYGSIGASAFAGLALLVATRAEKKSGYAEPGPRPERAERPPREPRERKVKAEDRGAPARSSKRRRRDPDSGELTRQLVMPGEDDDEVPLESLRPRGSRSRLPEAPAGAAWASESDDEFEEEDFGQGPPSYDADDADEDEYTKPAGAQGAAADDFRSRLAAVLGTTGEKEGAPAPAAPPRARRVTPVPIEEPDEYDAPAPPAPKRRGRKKPESYLPPEPESQEEPEQTDPEWIRIEDVPRVPQPESPAAHPAPSDEMIRYRPRRPTIAAAPAEQEQEPEQAKKPASPATRRRKSPAPSGESGVRSVSPKRPAPAERTAVTRVSGAQSKARSSKEKDPDAPPPRRGRPPKQRP